MPFGTVSKNEKCETLRTVSQVVSAVCLLILTIGFIVAGSWTVNTIHTLETTYHPEKLKNAMESIEDTLDTVHKSTFILKSGKPISVMDDIHSLVVSLEKVSTALQKIPIERMVTESESWRTMSSSIVSTLKKTINEL